MHHKYPFVLKSPDTVCNDYNVSWCFDEVLRQCNPIHAVQLNNRYTFVLASVILYVYYKFVRLTFSMCKVNIKF